jgi:hypothetical protein
MSLINPNECLIGVDERLIGVSIPLPGINEALNSPQICLSGENGVLVSKT